ncbi:hypothetical protein NDU88_000642 [Pleurodeles waltl]|uniref:Uncharacterized protein n=1 Tax=Pleurodeles waltl TaxID=8319 RepID=A0AAV7L753_PLEWA|nr:hypothetical protein NDU88_000642 [Pleurodeles waltl]
MCPTPPCRHRRRSSPAMTDAQRITLPRRGLADAPGSLGSNHRPGLTKPLALEGDGTPFFRHVCPGRAVPVVRDWALYWHGRVFTQNLANRSFVFAGNSGASAEGSTAGAHGRRHRSSPGPQDPVHRLVAFLQAL